MLSWICPPHSLLHSSHKGEADTPACTRIHPLRHDSDKSTVRSRTSQLLRLLGHSACHAESSGGHGKQTPLLGVTPNLPTHATCMHPPTIYLSTILRPTTAISRRRRP